MTASARDRVVVVGCGFAGEAIVRAARETGRDVIVTTRSGARATELSSRGVDAVVVEDPSALDRVIVPTDRVAVTFPPDGRSDAIVSALARGASALAYVSTTGVYGPARGRVDAATPVDRGSPKSALRLAAEAEYLAAGGVVLRAPGIYGVARGLHVRLRRGQFRLPGDGSQVVSRIHVDDLATFVLAALDRGPKGRVLVVGDDAPVPQGEVVRWLADAMGVPMPESAPLDEVDETLRHDRRADASEAKRVLGVTLRYPSYREGFSACLAEPTSLAAP